MRRSRILAATVLALGTALALGLGLGAIWGWAVGCILLSWIVMCILLMGDSVRHSTPAQDTSALGLEHARSTGISEKAHGSSGIQEPFALEKAQKERPEHVATDEQSEAEAKIAADDEPDPESSSSESSSAEACCKQPPEEGQDDLDAPSTVDDDAEPFSFSILASDLLDSNDPMLVLCDFCKSVSQNASASPFEHYLARRLSEAHVYDWEQKGDAPSVALVLPHRSGCFYFREESRVPLGFHLRILRIEAALNAALAAYGHFDDPLSASEEELFRFEQRVTSSICTQADNITSNDWTYLAMPWESGQGPSRRGEWAVRSSLAESIEALCLPYRLETNFRCNVAGGDIAIELHMTPGSVFPRTTYVDGMGIVATTSHMRNRYASAYAARLGILVANCAFRSSPRIRRVWIACIRTTPSKRSCFYGACIDRRDFTHVRMDAVRNPLAILQSLGATLELKNEVLQPLDQGFYLENERFCPPLRHDLWKLSERSLPPAAAISLGTQRVSGLSIHEELARMLVAEEALRGITTTDGKNSTQICVHSLFTAAHKTSDIDVWQATERTVEKLISGTITPDDYDLLEREIVSGDPLTQAVKRAQQALMHNRPEEALSQLHRALRPIDAQRLYVDTRSVAYRAFDSFAQRALYNRLNSHDTRCVVLVPDAYVIAHLLTSALLLSHENETDTHEALLHAQRAREIAPFSTQAIMSTVACFERAGDISEAISSLKELLECAYDPQSIALAYYRMASMQWQLENRKACRACYQLAAGFSPTLIPIIIAECHMLSLEDSQFSTSLEAEEVKEALREADIPLAPTARISFLLYDCAAASIDAEVFPVAHDLMRILESFTGDDVVHAIRNSLEREPDE